MTRDANTGEALAFVDEWARAGVEVAALAPGSRSTPLALALEGDNRIRLEVFLDERSAAFFALGAAKASGRPTVVLSTSGTAAANFHPAVVEAFHARVPLVVCTADRPPELRDTGANQAIDQVRLFGGAVRWFADVGVPEDGADAGRYWRSVAGRAVGAAVGPPAGPVHLNMAFREPLVPTGTEVVPAPGRPDGAPWVMSTAAPRVPEPADVERLARAVAASERGLIVAGWGAGADPDLVDRFAELAAWPVLADPLSGLRRGPRAVSTYDALLRAPEFGAEHRPDLVLHLGAPLTGKVATEWMGPSGPAERGTRGPSGPAERGTQGPSGPAERGTQGPSGPAERGTQRHGVHRVLVDPDGAWLDPTRGAAERIACDPDALLEALVASLPARTDSDWLGGWRQADDAARRLLDDLLDSWDEPFEGRVARDVAGCLPDGATLVVGSSMPVRDIEGFAQPRSGVRFLANRGASGIDGFTSTLLGVAATSRGQVAGLAGDLTLLHDVGGLLSAGRRGLNAVLVVIDNDGGGVFSFLPQAGLPDAFERLFGTPHGIDLTAVAAAYGVPAGRIERSSELVPAVEEALTAGGLRIVVVPTDRAANVTRHRQAWDAVASSVLAAQTARKTAR